MYIIQKFDFTRSKVYDKFNTREFYLMLFICNYKIKDKYFFSFATLMRHVETLTLLLKYDRYKNIFLWTNVQLRVFFDTGQMIKCL